MSAASDRQLFEISRTTDQVCQVPGCQAIRFAGQNQTPTCAHDLELVRRRRRPRGCLNAHQPQHQHIPY